MAMLPFCPETCHLFLCFMSLPFLTQGPFPQFLLSQAHRCYLLCWPRPGAAELRLGVPKVGRMSFCPLLCSDPLVLMLIKQYVLPPQTDPQPSFLPPSPCFPLLHESSLVLAICSDYPFPLLLGTGRKGRDAAMLPALQGMDSFLSLC